MTKQRQLGHTQSYSLASMYETIFTEKTVEMAEIGDPADTGTLWGDMFNCLVDWFIFRCFMSSEHSSNCMQLQLHKTCQENRSGFPRRRKGGTFVWLEMPQFRLFLILDSTCIREPRQVGKTHSHYHLCDLSSQRPQLYALVQLGQDIVVRSINKTRQIIAMERKTYPVDGVLDGERERPKTYYKKSKWRPQLWL